MTGTFLVASTALAAEAQRGSFADFDARARAGDRLKVVFFGASLTWGANASDPVETSYRAVMRDRFEQHYPAAHFRFRDAAIGGTGSQLGAFRLDRDVLAHRPDLVFVDFTANDDINSADPETLASYESILRRLATAGIPVVQVAFPFKWDIDTTKLPNMKRLVAHRALADTYGNGWGDAVTWICQAVDAGRLKTGDLWVTDGVHPHDPGYREFAAAAWDGYLAAVKAGLSPRVPAQPVYADTYLTLRRIHLAGLPSLPRGWSKGRPNLTAVNHDWLMSRWLDDLVAARNRALDEKGKPRPEPQVAEPLRLQVEAASILLFGECTADHLAVALAGPDVVRFFNKESMQPRGEVKLPAPGGLAYDKAGTLFAVSGQGVVTIADGKITPLVTSDLEKPMGLAVDAEGKIYVADRGTQQVKVFTAAGAFERAVGVAGGRPLPGRWVPGGMRNPKGIAIDPQGRLWVAEETMYPKRFSVWAADGKLVTDFIGPATYGGMGACADPDDKTRIFGNGCEFQLVYAANKATVTANLLDCNIVGEFLKINGREYVMSKRGQLYQRRGDALVKVAEMKRVRLSDLPKSKLPLTAPKDAKDWFSYLWSDLNDDGQMQAEECQTTTASLDGGYWGGYWLDDKFNIYTGPGGYGTQTVCTVPLAGWTKAGTPTWDLTKIRVIVANREAPGPNKLYCAGGGKVIVGTPLTCYADDGAKLWSYGPDMFNDVHGSHNAPIPERDDHLYGTLSCIGTAETPVGKAFAMNSNMGRLFIMTTDGLFVGSVFQDCRIGPDAWPNETKAGAPMGGVTMGGEWFGGYFFKAKATGEYYLIAGPNNYNLIKLNGFDTLQAIPASTITLTSQDLLAADKLQRERAVAKAAASTLTITRIATPAQLDGRLEKYAKESVVSWSASNAKARGAVATDGASLYLAYDVNGDANPMVNAGQDVTQLFVTGDSVDLQLGTNPDANAKRTEAVPGDLRLLISVLDGKPAAVLYRWKTTGEKHPQTFTCPWRQYTVEDVQVLTVAKVTINRRASGYTVEAAVPLKTLGFDPQPGKTYKLDLGVIFSDATGTNRSLRMYWANKATGLVNDVPGEIMPTPNLWGVAALAGEKTR